MAKFNPNPAYRKNILAGLQVPANVEPELRKFLSSVKEHIELQHGNKGQPKARFATLDELEERGLISTIVKGGRAEIRATAPGESTTGGTGSTAVIEGGTTTYEGGTVSGDIVIQNNDPSLEWHEEDAAANNKRWNAIADGEQLQFKLLTDAHLETEGAAWLTVDRTGQTIDDISLIGPTNIRDGATLRAYDSTNTDYIQITDNGTNAQISTNTNSIQINAGGGLVDLTTGTDLRISDGGDTDWMQFSHDGTDFNIAGTNTAALNITGITDLSVVNYSFDVDQTVGAGQDNYVLTYDDTGGLIALEAIPTQIADGTTTDATLRWSGSAWVESTLLQINDAGGNHSLTSVLDEATGNEVALSLNYTVNKVTSGDDTGLLIAMTDTDSPGTSLLAEYTVGGVTKFSWSANPTFTMYDNSGVDSAAFNHDGTDFNLALTGTTDYNITGLTNFVVGNYTFVANQTLGAGQDNYVLTYDNAGGTIQFEAATGGGGASALNDLTDVTITSAGTGDLLRYNGSAWVDYPDSNFAAASHTHLLAAGATDVTATAAEVNLLDLAGLTAGWALIADTATTASWQAITESDISDLQAYLLNVVQDTTPQLGGNLDVQANVINTSTVNGNISIQPNGTGNVVLGNYSLDGDQTVGAGQDNYVLTYDNGTGLISLEAAAGGASALNDLSDVTITTATDGDFLQYNGAAWVNIADLVVENGNVLRVQDSTDADYIQLSHDGTNATVTTNAGNLQLNATLGAVVIGESAEQLWLRSGSTMTIYSAANTANVQIGHDGTDLNVTGSNAAHFDLHGGMGLRIYDAFNTDSVAFDHDGTDLNTTFTTTTDWNVTGLNGFNVVNYNFDVDQTVGAGQDNYVLTYDNGTGLISLEASAGGSGALNDLTDVTVATPLDGDILVYDTTGANWENQSNGGRNVRIYDSTGVDYLDLSSTLTESVINAVDQMQLQIAGTEVFRIGSSTVAVRSGNTLRFLDSTNTDQANFSHDGTDFNTTFATTTDWNFYGITGAFKFKNAAQNDLFMVDIANTLIDIHDGYTLRIRDSGDTDYLDIYETGTSCIFDTNNNPIQFQLPTSSSFTVAEGGTAKFQVDMSGNNVRVRDGYELRCYESADSDFTAVSNNGTNGFLSVYGGSTLTVMLSANTTGRPQFPNHSTTASAANAFLNSSSGILQRSTSSLRYKRDVQDLTMAEARRVLDLRPVRYRSAIPEDNQTWSFYGFIAEEVALVDPRLTYMDHPTKEVRAVDPETGRERQWIEPDETQPMRPESVNYDRLTVQLLAVIKDHDSRIAALEAAAGL